MKLMPLRSSRAGFRTGLLVYVEKPTLCNVFWFDSAFTQEKASERS